MPVYWLIMINYSYIKRMFFSVFRFIIQAAEKKFKQPIVTIMFWQLRVDELICMFCIVLFINFMLLLVLISVYWKLMVLYWWYYFQKYDKTFWRFCACHYFLVFCFDCFFTFFSTLVSYNFNQNDLWTRFYLKNKFVK